MTTKQYVENLANELKGQMDDNLADRKKMKFWYNLGTIVTGVCGASYLATNPYFGLPVIGFAVGLQFTKKMKEEVSKQSYNSLIGQAEHLNNMLKDGIDIKSEAMANRKDLINQKELVRRGQESDYLNALASHRFASALVAGAAVVGGFVTSSLVPVASAVLLYIQKKKDDKVVASDKVLEDTVMTMNNVINDYNTAGKVLNLKNKQQTTTTKKVVVEEPATSKKYSIEDEAAVDAYMKGLDRFEEYDYERQKRRI